MLTKLFRPAWRRLAPVLLVAVVLGLSTGCAQSPRKSDGDTESYSNLRGGQSDLAYVTEFPVGSAAEANAKGDAALAAGDIDRALFEYIRALQKEGDNAEVLYKIGGIHAARDNNQLAELAFRKALAVDPRHAGALTGLGILLTKQRNYAEAERSLSAAVRENPRLARAYNALGVLADINRDYALAQRYYQDALAIAPRSPMLHNNLGYSRYLGSNYTGAIAEFERALELSPNYALAWRNLGLVYTKLARYDEAVQAFGKVQDLPKAYNDVGYLAMVAGRLDDAEAFFDQALLLSPEYYNLASENAQRVQTLKGGQ
jgi:Flp pilus assembly protein TadD